MKTSDIDPTLPEYRDNPFIANLAPLLPAKEVREALRELPRFEQAERQYPTHLRMHCVCRLGRWFEPGPKDLQLYSSLGVAIRQGYLHRNMRTGSYNRGLNSPERPGKKEHAVVQSPERSAAASISLIGCPGTGKTSSVRHILGLNPQLIRHNNSASVEQVVYLDLDCPSGGSPIQLCLSFFDKIGSLTDTPYFERFKRAKCDEMLIHMARLAKLHAVGVLVIDEIQHLKQARGTGAETLLNFLVTLVNTIGIPVIIVGTMGALPLLQGNFRQARRASGLGSLIWDRMKEGPDWEYFVRRMWSYQWTKEVTPLTDEICHILYDESQGIVDIVVRFFMLSQWRALELGLTGRPERLDPELLRQVAREHFGIIRPMIEALRRNDMEDIARFDDLQSLRYHAAQVFSDAVMRASPAGPHSGASL